MTANQEKLIGIIIENLRKIKPDESYNRVNLSSNIKKYLSKNIIGFKSYLSENNLNLRIIRLNLDDQVKENVPFSPISLYDLKFEIWDSEDSIETSSLKLALKSIYLFLTIKETNETQFKIDNLTIWECNESELSIIREEYEIAKSIVQNGIILTDKLKGGKTVTENNLLKSRDTKILHMRPHAKNKDDYDIKYFKYTNGEIRITKQSFWLNKKFINTLIDSKWKINLKEE